MTAWFACVGAPLTAASRADAWAYLDAFGFDGVGIASVPDWRAAGDLLRSPQGDADWWAVEEAERRRLLDAATVNDALYAALTDVTVTVSDAALVACPSSDPYLRRIAAGAAAQAAYLDALARLSGAGPEHGFAAKHRLFAVGHWPLGIVDRTLRVF